MTYLIIILSIFLLIVIVGCIRECIIADKCDLEIKALEQEREDVIKATENLVLSAHQQILNKLKAR